LTSRKIRVAVLGTGNIGTDLAERLLSDEEFELVAFVGRRSDSPGLERMKSRIPNLISNGFEGLEALLGGLDGVFDATSALDHLDHWPTIQTHGKWVIDLTPSRLGSPMVPELLGRHESMALSKGFSVNYSMVTCGGQSAAPLIFGMGKAAKGAVRLEISSSISSKSAGPATRRNLEQYISATENLASLLVPGVPTKAILVLNPIEPPAMMRTTVSIEAGSFDLELAKSEVNRIVEQVNHYVPGYSMVVEPHLTSAGSISATVKVTGQGFFLPDYAGNLDIINSAAVETARRHMASFVEGASDVV
jgi:acetaldehyde dehydrogenase (acetylating)